MKLMTIRQRKGRLDHLTIGFCGDLKFGRTVHSLTAALSQFEGNRFVFISPEDLRLPRYVKTESLEPTIAIARSKMKDYKLDNTKLIVLQGMNNEAVDISSIRAMVMEDFYKNSEQRLVEQKQKIATLEQNLERYKTFDELGKKIIPELKVLYPSVKTVSISHAIELAVDSVRVDTVTLAVLKFGKHPGAHEKEKIAEWLKARTGAKQLRLITE